MTVNISDYPNLEQALTPPQLRKLPQEQLVSVCRELREYLLNSVSISSGHFASGLGTVELTFEDIRKGFDFFFGRFMRSTF